MQRDVILIFGQTGCGKTTLASKIIAEYPRVFVADAGFRDYPGVRYTESYEELLASMENAQAFGTHRPFRLAYVFLPQEYPMTFATATAAKNCLLVLEEGDRFDVDATDGYIDYIFRGRHYGGSLLWVGLHPRACPTEVRRQATRIISFKQIFPDDLDHLAEIIGDDAYKLPGLGGPPNSPPHEYLEWTSQAGSKFIKPLTKP